MYSEEFLGNMTNRIYKILMMILIRYGIYVVYRCNSEKFHISNAKLHLSELLLKNVDIFSTIPNKREAICFKIFKDTAHRKYFLNPIFSYA